MFGTMERNYKICVLKTTAKMLDWFYNLRMSNLQCN